MFIAKYECNDGRRIIHSNNDLSLSHMHTQMRHRNFAQLRKLYFE